MKELLITAAVIALNAITAKLGRPGKQKAADVSASDGGEITNI